MIRRSSATSLKLAGLATCLLAFTGCSLFDEPEPERIPGQRVAVLSLDQRLTTDLTIKDRPVLLPEATVNTSWVSRGGNQAQAIGHLALGADPQVAWQAQIGEIRKHHPGVQPIAAAGQVFTVDSFGHVSAFALASGQLTWRVGIAPAEQEENALAGGLGFGDGKVFATAGFQELVALDAANGAVLWRRSVSGPLRGAPVYADGRVYSVSVDNELIVTNSSDGSPAWAHAGLEETERVLGAAPVAISGNFAAAVFSSGEVFAYQANDGRPLWSENVSSVQRSSAVWAMNDIRAPAVIDRNRIFAINVAGRLIALDQRSGNRLWQRDVGATEAAAVAGDYLFVLSTKQELAAITRDTGEVRWIVQLAEYVNEAELEDPLFWAGPVVAGGRVWVVGSNGARAGIDPQQGKVVVARDTGVPLRVAPLVVDNTMILQGADGSLLALR